MTPDLFQTDQLLERIEILEKKMDELMKLAAGEHEPQPQYVCNYPNDEFCSFWLEYPRKQDMKKAWTAWRKCKTRPPLEEIIAAVKKQKKSEQWKRGIIPLPTTWINGERWDDGP